MSFRKHGALMLSPGFVGFKDSELSAGVRRIFPLLVDAAEKAEGYALPIEKCIDEEEDTYRPLGDAVLALRAAMQPEPCPVCGLHYAAATGDCPAELQMLLCTRSSGHAGDHCAHDGTRRIASWPNEAPE